MDKWRVKIPEGVVESNICDREEVELILSNFLTSKHLGGEIIITYLGDVND